MEDRRDAKGNGAYRAKDQIPGPNSDKHCHRRAKLLYFFMLGMRVGCRDGSCPVLLLSLPSELKTNASKTQCAQSFKEMKDHKNPSDVLMRTIRYKYINGADNRGRHSFTRR